MPMLWSPFSFARAKRAPPKAAFPTPKAARASRAREKGDHNMGAGNVKGSRALAPRQLCPCYAYGPLFPARARSAQDEERKRGR